VFLLHRGAKLARCLFSTHARIFAQPPFRADAEAISDDQHSDQQFRIDRRPSCHTVERRQMLPQVNKAVDRPQQMRLGHVAFEPKLVEESVLLDCRSPIIDCPPAVVT